MKPTIQKLSSGLRVINTHIPSLKSATFSVWVDQGSKNEEQSKLGISHFFEHIVFKGGKKYTTSQAVSEALDSIGAQFNAGTNKEYTTFYAKSRTDNLDIVADVLSDMLISPKLDEKEIEMEKGVIIEEMKMYEDLPRIKSWEVFESLVYGNPAHGRSIIGEKETVKSITKADFEHFMNSNYHVGRMLVSIAGGFSDKDALMIAEKFFGGLSTSGSNLVKLESKIGEKRLMVSNKPIEQSHVVVGFSGEKSDSEHFYAEELVATIIGGGMSSRAFNEIREKRGLAYTVRTNTDRLVETGSVGTYMGVDPKNTLESIKVLLSMYLGLATGEAPITEGELKKAKEYLKGHLALSLEDTSEVESYFAHDILLLNKFETPEEEMAKYDSVTLEEANRSAKRMFERSVYASVISPLSSIEDEIANVLSG
jgi:predicted Zn-dependent peptidase